MVLVDMSCIVFIFFLMIRRPPRSTRTDTLFPYTTLFRSRLWSVATSVRSRQPLMPAQQLPNVSATWFPRSEEHTSELQSLMRISYAVFCLKKKKHHNPTIVTQTNATNEQRLTLDSTTNHTFEHPAPT